MLCQIIKKYQAYLKATRKARDILHRQRTKTGVAIPGTPHPILKQDVKYDAQYGKASVTTGEQLAQASLASELMVCGLAEVPYDKYIGRGQYPKFRTTPIAPSCPTVVPSIHNEHLSFFSSASKLLDQLPCTILQIIQLHQSADLHSTAQFKQELKSTMAAVYERQR